MSMTQHAFHRRLFLGGAAAIAAGGELALHRRLSLAAELHGGHPLAPRAVHHAPKAKHLILFFFTGGLSHVDTFDYKPKLQEDHGKTISGASRPLKGSPWKFQAYGQCGKMVSELFPHVGALADDFCFLHTVRGDSGGHSAATLGMLTGSITFPMPSIGSWISYGLGTQNLNLPPYIVLAAKEPYNAYLAWDSSFLPAYHKGIRLIPGPSPLADVKSPIQAVTRRELENIMLRDLNDDHLHRRAGELDLKARMTSFETAQGLMREAPEVFEVAQEPQHVLDLYGTQAANPASFAAQCLMARRMVERGVRVVYLFDVGSNGNWDNHSNMSLHEGLARNVDQPLAGLVRDLKQRGLLEETLVVGCTEFGRTPWEDTVPEGRGHFSRNFTCFLAGGGAKGGLSYGVSDEYGATAIENPVHTHDFHATVLHLMGLDHTRLTYRYSGRDFRLTDVHGNVVLDVIA
jgi:hypothetical protein